MVSAIVISEGLLLSLLEASRRLYPKEFFSLLGGEVKDSRVYVEEVLYVPWREGYTHAIIDLDLVPYGTVASFHSHPGPAIPSAEDLEIFPLLGFAHLIAGYPFTLENVRAFDNEGNEIKLLLGQRASF